MGNDFSKLPPSPHYIPLDQNRQLEQGNRQGGLGKGIKSSSLYEVKHPIPNLSKDSHSPEDSEKSIQQRKIDEAWVEPIKLEHKDVINMYNLSLMGGYVKDYSWFGPLFSHYKATEYVKLDDKIDWLALAQGALGFILSVLQKNMEDEKLSLQMCSKLLTHLRAWADEDGSTLNLALGNEETLKLVQAIIDILSADKEILDDSDLYRQLKNDMALGLQEVFKIALD